MDAFGHAVNTFAFNYAGYITIMSSTAQQYTIRQNKIESKRIFDQKDIF